MLTTRRLALMDRPAAGLCVSERGALTVGRAAAAVVAAPLVPSLLVEYLSNCAMSKKSCLAAAGRLGEWMFVDGSDMDARLGGLSSRLRRAAVTSRSSVLLTREHRLLRSSLLFDDVADDDGEVSPFVVVFDLVLALSCSLLLPWFAAAAAAAVVAVLKRSTRALPIVGRL